jgi:GTP-binding protein EngB required for normal cell division
MAMNAAQPTFEAEQARSSSSRDVRIELATITEKGRSLVEHVRALSFAKIGFLGESQVGKSSVVNALLEQRLLPSGGIGPLTALATEIRFDKEKSISVVYNDREPLIEARTVLELSNADEVERGSEALVCILAQLRHVFSEDGRLRELNRAKALDLLNLILGDRPSPCVTDAFCSKRAAEARNLLGTNEEISAQSMNAQGFGKAMLERIAGWRSPLIDRLRVSLDHQFLSGVELTDLPGVGVVGDIAGDVAKEYLKRNAEIVVVVLRNNGVTETLISLFDSVKLLERMVGSESDEYKSLELVLAVTSLDDVVRSKRVLMAEDLGSQSAALPPPSEMFRQLSLEQDSFVRQQLFNAMVSLLKKKSLVVTASGETEKMEQKIRRVCREMQVHCVCAPDYLGFLEKNCEDNFIKDDVTATNIDHLRESLVSLSRTTLIRRAELLEARFLALRDQMKELVEAVKKEPGAGAGIELELKMFLRDEVIPAFNSLKQKKSEFEAIGRREVIKESVSSLAEATTGSPGLLVRLSRLFRRNAA